MNLLAELKRRNVLRMAGLYLVGAWLLTQVASTVLPVFEAPGWTLRALIIALAVGFIPALIFSWVFELTPQGLKRDEDVPPEQSVAPQTARRMDRMIIVVLLLALGYFGIDKFVLAPRREATVAARPANSAASDVSSKSIAVMPFLNISNDPAQEYFSDGMTEEVLNALAKVPSLAVTARTSVFSLKGERHDVREIGKRLGVDYLLEGSVRRADDEVRITAQLIRTDNGFHLWSETYDRKLVHVFALQAELAGAIAKALQLPLGVGGDKSLVSQRTDDPQAYSLYLQARAAYRKRGDNVMRSVELYRAALQRDPKFAPAWAGLCGSLAVLGWYLPDEEKVHIPQYLREAEEAGQRAAALAPDLIEAQTMLGKLYTVEWKWMAAEEHFQRALSLAPDDAETLFSHGEWLYAQGRIDEALQAARRTVTLDPLVPIFLNMYGYMLAYSRRFEESIAQLEAARALDPGLWLPTGNLIRTYLLAGRIDDAERVLDAYEHPPDVEQLIYRTAIRLARDPGQRKAIAREIGDEKLGGVLAALGQRDIAASFAFVEKQIDQHYTGQDPIVLLRSPKFEKYRTDPRYLRLLKKAGFDDTGAPLPERKP